MKKVKAFLFHPCTIFLLAVILGMVLLYAYVLNPEPAEIGQVIGAQTFIGADGKEYVKYAFVGGEMDIAVSQNVEQAAQTNQVKIVAEDISQRTSSSRTFVTDRPDVRISEFITGPQYFKDDLGYWWQAEYAYATPAEFAKLPKTQLYARLNDTSRFAFIKKAFATTSTFYPDPDPESTSVDGRVARENAAAANETWTQIREGVGNTANSSNAVLNDLALIKTDSDTTDSWQQMGRAVFGFDTSAIPDTDVISSATFSIKGSGKTDNFSQSVAIDRNPPATATNLVSGDYDIAGWAGVEQASNRITFASWSTTGYNDFSLNATGLGNISKTGVTWLGTRASGDFDNSPPTWSSNLTASVTGHSADRADTDQDPKLVVVHAPPVPSTGSTWKQDVIFKQEVIFK